MTTRKFKFLLDPLFLFSLTLYCLNRYFFSPAEFLNCRLCDNYLGDLLLVPVLVPIILTISKLFRIRTSTSPPTLIEIILPLTIWSVIFEFVGPYLFNRGISDPWDILAYALGGLISWLIWQRNGLSIPPPD